MVVAIFTFLLLLFLIAVLGNYQTKKKEKEIEFLTEKVKILSQNKSVLQTQMKRTEEKLQSSQSFKSYFDSKIPYVFVNRTGALTLFNDRFVKSFGLSIEDQEKTIFKIFPDALQQGLDFRKVIQQNKRDLEQNELKYEKDGETFYYSVEHIPQVKLGNDQGAIFLFYDISKYAKDQKEVERIIRGKLDEEIEYQKRLSYKILEAQQKERARIGKDLHDGIGQMLTALKFNIESISIPEENKLFGKIEKTKDIAGSIIKKVRQATFNLKPPELEDYGLDSALEKMAQSLSLYTGVEVNYVNRTDFDLRLTPKQESNIYSIVQEATNNAIKYSGVNHVTIFLSHSQEMVSIKIIDEGKGFDYKKQKSQTMLDDESTKMGLSSMQERVNALDGRMFINTKPGKGTSITVNIPIFLQAKTNSITQTVNL